MKTLLLLRHAKAEREDEAPSDHARRLTSRGERDAARVGAWLLEQALRPDAAISSTAARARQTAELATAKLVTTTLGVPVEFRDDLYLAPPGAYIDVLKSRADDESCLLLVGHNPGIEDLASRLSGEEFSMATAALAHIRLPVSSWTEVRSSPCGKLIELWRPHDEA